MSNLKYICTVNTVKQVNSKNHNTEQEKQFMKYHLFNINVKTKSFKKFRIFSNSFIRVSELQAIKHR